MRYIKKPVAYLAWALAFGLSVALAWEFHGGQNKIAIGLALLALILSACSLLFARDAWRKKAWPEFVFGIILWMAGAGFFTITELGYWDSSSAEHHAKYQQLKKAKARHEGLADQKWDALTTGNIPMSPAQIQAKINAAHMNERWTTTKGCTVVTAAPSRDFCKGVFNLEGELAQAQQRLELEKEFAAVGAEQETKLVHNLLAGAEVLNRRLKLEDERLAGDIIVFAAWILLLLARDLGALVADPLGRRQEASGQAKDEVAPLTGTKFSPPVYAPRTPLPHPAGKIAGVKADVRHAEQSEKFAETNSSEKPNSSPEVFPDARKNPLPAGDSNPHPMGEGPGDGGTPAPAPDPVQEVATPVSANVVQFFKDKDTPKAEWKIAKPARKKPKDNSVSRWMREHTQSSDAGTGTKDCYAHYHMFCEERKINPLPKRQFSAVLAGILDMPKSKEGKRHKQGRIFPLVVIERQSIRRRA